MNRVSGSCTPVGRRARPLWKVAGDEECVRDGESVCVFKGHAGLHYKAEVPLMRSEETVGVAAPFSQGTGGMEWGGGGLTSSITIRADGHMGVLLTAQ